MNEIVASPGRGMFWPSRESITAVVAALLVALADFLFWGSGIGGLNLFTFFIAIAAGILIVRGPNGLTRPMAIAWVLALVGALPLLEAASMWGLLAATFGVGMLALAAAGELPRRAVDLPAVLVRFGLAAPGRFIADALRIALRAAERGLGKFVVRGGLMWIVPLVLAAVFLKLFSMANPVIEKALHAIPLDEIAGLLDPWRVIVWGVVVCFAWPLLAPKLLRLGGVPQAHGPRLAPSESVVFGSGAILRALVLFNLLFALQTGLDIAYLWGGLALPDGLTYASYAHRGAYPLVVTALLAAGFVLAAMRHDGPAERSPLIRRLVYAFIAQNVMLVVSSILRLDLYVESYMLTELRVAAGVWMGLVAVGLVLILLRIVLRKSNRWLLATNLLAVGLTLYACAYIDAAALISRFNVDHSRELTGSGGGLDIQYLWDDLGHGAIPALDHFIIEATERGIAPDVVRAATIARDELAAAFAGRLQDRRLWSFRDWRLDQYLVEQPGYFAESPEAGRTGEATRPDPTMP